MDAVLTEHGKPVQAQGSNIRHYSEYLLERARSYREIQFDFVRGGQGRLKRQSVDKGLLRETESVQTQIDALLKCDVGTPWRCLDKGAVEIYADRSALSPAVNK